MSQSASSSLQRVLVIGYGRIGSTILRGLSQHPNSFHTTLLVRPASLAAPSPQLQSIQSLGVHLVPGDVTDPSSLPALTSFDTIIAALSGPLISAQSALIPLAKAAGVKRFVPSEFGTDLQAVGRGSICAPHWDPKLDVVDQLKSSGLPYTVIYTSLFMELFLTPFVGIDLAARSVTAVGSLDVPLSTTSLTDIGNIVPHILLDPSTINSTVRLASDRVTYRQIADSISRHSGQPTSTTVVSVEDARAKVQANPGNFAVAIPVVIASGKGFAFDEGEVWNKKHLPQYQTQTVDQYIADKVKSTA